MEIERKFLIRNMPRLSDYPFHRIEQGYLCTDPVVRVRREDENYILTYKGSGMLAHEEYNLPLTKESYEHLLPKADGNILTKTRYLIPLDGQLKAELDVFEGKFEGLTLVEVEFPSEEAAGQFVPPDWFGEDVTYDSAYHNSTMSLMK